MNQYRSPAVPWLYRAPGWVVALLSVAAAVLVFAVVYVCEWWVYTVVEAVREMILASGCLAGLLTGILTYQIIQYGRRRRDMLLHHLQVISETNHHIRNAMETIQMSAHLCGQRQIVEIVDTATDRIQWALREILGSEPPG